MVGADCVIVSDTTAPVKPMGSTRRHWETMYRGSFGGNSR